MIFAKKRTDSTRQDGRALASIALQDVSKTYGKVAAV